MSIEKRGPNSWRIGIQVNTPIGWQWIRKTLRFDPSMTEAQQRKQAKLREAELRVRIANGEFEGMQTSKVTVAQMYEKWMDKYVEPNLSPETARTYRNFFTARILPELGELPLNALTPERIMEWIDHVRTSPRKTTALPDADLKRRRTPSDQAKRSEKPDARLSARTVQHYFDALDAMLAKAVQWDYLKVNPCSRADRPKARKPRAKFLTEERAAQLLGVLHEEPNPSYRLALLLALTCGLRLSEVGALRLGDIDWKRETIDISAARKYTPETGSGVGETKTPASDRVILLPHSLFELLVSEREAQDQMARLTGSYWKGEGWIVHREDGRPMHHDTPSKWFRKFADAHGFTGVTFHQLRHTHASILLANNIDIVAVAARMGHEDPSTTLRIYAHALPRRDGDSAQAVDALFSPAIAAAASESSVEAEARRHGFSSADEFIEAVQRAGRIVTNTAQTGETNREFPGESGANPNDPDA